MTFKKQEKPCCRRETGFGQVSRIKHALNMLFTSIDARRTQSWLHG